MIISVSVYRIRFYSREGLTEEMWLTHNTTTLAENPSDFFVLCGQIEREVGCRRSQILETLKKHGYVPLSEVDLPTFNFDPYKDKGI